MCARDSVAQVSGIRLWDLTAQYRMIADAAHDGEDVDALLVALEGEITVKVEGIGGVLSELDASEDALKTEATRLAARAKSIANRRQRLREYLRDQMDSIGVRKIQTPRWTFTVVDDPGRVEIENAEIVPDEYTRTKREVDKDAVKAAFKEHGEVVPGTRVVLGRSLRVKG